MRKRKCAKYKPPGNLIEAIAAGRLLLLSPWPHYVPDKSRCTRAECTAMNAMAETIALAATAKAAKAAKSANRTEIISPANEQYENRSRLLRYHYKQEPLRMQRGSERYKQCSNAALFSQKQRQSVTNVTNVTHFRVRVSTFCGKDTVSGASVTNSERSDALHIFE